MGAMVGVYLRVDPHPPSAVFCDDVYLDSAVLVPRREHAINRDGVASMDEFVPDSDEVGCIGGRVGVVLLDEVCVSVNGEKRDEDTSPSRLSSSRRILRPGRASLLSDGAVSMMGSTGNMTSCVDSLHD